eukprot:TRINITY_DN3081_c0_g1_i1.p1 TRINITY_DN3081_c0_g1~~TRINITY_DN3081_c0_g1_i1.p1  ORF type:complete len:159 (+),score=39.74 TRINITY_DN3081_c0_g1_i1:61-537(+)
MTVTNEVVPSRVGREKQRYSKDGCRLVAGGVLVRNGTNGIEILAVTSSNRGTWVVPKGGWETDETAEEAALRESLEEGGVVGEIVSPLKSNSIEGSKHIYNWFLMNVVEVRDVWAESDTRRRKFIPLDEALDIVDVRYRPLVKEVQEYLIRANSYANC